MQEFPLSVVAAVIPYENEDRPVHSDVCPFCDDWTCPCHGDDELVWAACSAPYLDGLLTAEESSRLYNGSQV